MTTNWFRSTGTALALGAVLVGIAVVADPADPQAQASPVDECVTYLVRNTSSYLLDLDTTASSPVPLPCVVPPRIGGNGLGNVRVPVGTVTTLVFQPEWNREPVESGRTPLTLVLDAEHPGDPSRNTATGSAYVGYSPKRERLYTEVVAATFAPGDDVTSSRIDVMASVYWR